MANSLPMTRFHSNNARSSFSGAASDWQVENVEFIKVPWLAKLTRIWFIAQLLITAYHPHTSKFYGRRALAITLSNQSDDASFSVASMEFARAHLARQDDDWNSMANGRSG